MIMNVMLMLLIALIEIIHYIERREMYSRPGAIKPKSPPRSSGKNWMKKGGE